MFLFQDSNETGVARCVMHDGITFASIQFVCSYQSAMMVVLPTIDEQATMFAYDYRAMQRAMGPIRGELLAHVMAPSRLAKLAGLGLI
jgi:hypothetical protein